jgi:general stress protein CsbA
MISSLNASGSWVLFLCLLVLSISLFASWGRTKSKVSLSLGLVMLEWTIYRGYWSMYWMLDWPTTYWLNSYVLPAYLWVMAITAAWAVYAVYERKS